MTFHDLDVGSLFLWLDDKGIWVKLRIDKARELDSTQVWQIGEKGNQEVIEPSRQQLENYLLYLERRYIFGEGLKLCIGQSIKIIEDALANG